MYYVNHQMALYELDLNKVETLYCSFSSVQFNCSVMSDSLRPHGSQLARPPCPSPILGLICIGITFKKTSIIDIFGENCHTQVLLGLI